ncbi:hypothetical protein OIE68_07820 [Nocardia vinacea]|nr:hypothetical protein OIE68_07820 [Nocardia vinacea]
MDQVRLGSVGAVKSRVAGVDDRTSKTTARAALRVVPIGPCVTSWKVMAAVTRLTQVSAVSQRSVSTRSLPWRVTKPTLFHLPATNASRLPVERSHCWGTATPGTLTLLGRGTGHQYVEHAKKSDCQGTAMLAVTSPGCTLAWSSRNDGCPLISTTGRYLLALRRN